MDDEESPRSFAEFTLRGMRFFALLRMTIHEGLRMTFLPLRACPELAEGIRGSQRELQGNFFTLPLFAIIPVYPAIQRCYN